MGPSATDGAISAAADRTVRSIAWERYLAGFAQPAGTAREPTSGTRVEGTWWVSFCGARVPDRDRHDVPRQD
jgi:hypothetical protein